jgi:hypothetical protein
MCGPPDFAALDLCVARLTALSTVGLATYSVCKAAALRRKLGPRDPVREEQSEPAPRRAPIAETRHGCADA